MPAGAGNKGSVGINWRDGQMDSKGVQDSWGQNAAWEEDVCQEMDA